MKRSNRILWAMLVALMLVATACNGGGGDNGDDGDGDTGNGNGVQQGGTFRIELSEPAQLDPAQSDDSEETIVTRNIFEGLVTYDVNTAAVKPGVATKFVPNEDNTVWTFTLRKDAKFSNGEPVTAQSFIDGMNRSTAPSTGEDDTSPISYHLEGIKGYAEHHGTEDKAGTGAGLSGLKALDPYTLEVTLSEPDPDFAIKTGHTVAYPLPKKATIDAQKPSFSEFPIGNGQFMLEGPEPWKHNQSITMVPNPLYKGEKKKSTLERVIFRIFPDQDTAYLEWQAGNLDYLRPPPEKLGEVQTTYKDKLLKEPTSVLTYVGVTLKNAPLDNKKVRQALSMAIDRDAIIKTVLADTQVPAAGIIPPVMPGHREEGPCKYCKFNPTEAKKLLQESGARFTKPITLSFNAGAGHEQWTQAVAAQIKQNLGVDVKVESVTGFSANFIPRLRRGQVTGLFRLGWGMDYPTPQNFLKPLFGTSSIGKDNLTEYSNPAFDELIKKAALEKDVQERVKVYQQAEDIIVEDLPVLPMWFRISYRLGDVSRFGGLQVDPFDDPSISTVFLKAGAKKETGGATDTATP